MCQLQIRLCVLRLTDQLFETRNLFTQTSFFRLYPIQLLLVRRHRHASRNVEWEWRRWKKKQQRQHIFCLNIFLWIIFIWNHLFLVFLFNFVGYFFLSWTTRQAEKKNLSKNIIDSCVNSENVLHIIEGKLRMRI